MLKRFFVSMLGTIAGIWISTIIFVIIIGALVAGIVASGFSSAEKPKVEKNSILHIELAGDYVERAQPSSFSDLLRSGVSESKSVCDLIEAVRRASSDKKIAGIFLDCQGASMDVAAREELAGAIEDFRSEGKWVYAYGDAYSQGDYYLASYADKIYLNPMGVVDLRGLGSMTPFVKGLLDKLDVNMQIVKVGTFKSAVEPLILDQMSEPARLQAQTYIDSIWSYVSGAIARNRKLGADDVRQYASDMMCTWTASRVLDAGIVTDLAYRRQVQQKLADETGTKYDEVRLIDPEKYLKANPGKDYSNGSHIAVLYAEGDIVTSGSGIASDDYVDDIIDLANDDDVVGLVMRVNSGGGSAFASEQIWEALEYFKQQDKPFVVSMGGVAASGAYYISCGADYIWADTTTLTGSIGVFGIIPDYSRLASEKLGITFSTVETNPNAIFPTPLAPMTPEQYSAMQQSVEDIYDTFTKRVADGRHMTQDSVKVIGEGRVWAAGDALRIGLVDQLGSLRDAIEYTAELADVEPSHIALYPDYEEELWQKLLSESGITDLKADPAGARTALLLNRLRHLEPIQALEMTTPVR